MMNRGLQGKVCIVTGAAQGIGKACAAELAKEQKMRVVCADLNGEGAKATADGIIKDGGEAFSFAGDMSDEETIKRLVGETVAKYGAVNCLSSNVAATAPAFTMQDTTFDNYGPDYMEKSFKINTIGTFLLLKYCIPEMLKAGGGSIVCMSSAAANFGGEMQTVYGMTKAALEKLVRGTAAMYGKKGIRCNAVEPSVTLTPALLTTYPEDVVNAMRMGIMNPEFTDGDGIATVVAFLLSDDAYTIQGATIPADNGYHVVSGMSGATAQYAYDVSKKA